MFWCFSFRLDFVKFHHEINILKSILYKISCPRDFVDKYIKEFLDRVLTREVVVSTVPKNVFMIGLPYLGKLSLQIRSSSAIFELFSWLSASWSTFSHSKIKFLFSYVQALFIDLSAVVTMLPIKRHFKVRMCEHLGVSAHIGKRVKRDNDSAIKDHHLFCNHSSGFNNFSILARNNHNFKVTLMESLLINRDHSSLNKNRHLLSLELFDDWGT